MKVSFKSLALRYEVSFQTPFFRIGYARPALFESLYRALAQFGLETADLQGFGGTSLADQRARVNLFKGNANIEITADKVFAHFRNAVGKEDVQLIQDCLKKLLAAIEAFATESPLGGEQFVLYPTVEFESEAACTEFLRTLHTPAKAPEFVEKYKAKIWPSYKVELEDGSAGWRIDVSISRAWLLPKSLFVAAHADFSSGASSTKLDERATLLAEAVGSVLKSLDLSAQ